MFHACFWWFVLTREIFLQVAETKARSMEEEVTKLQKCLQDKDEQLHSSTHSAEQVKSSLNLHSDLVPNHSCGVQKCHFFFLFLGDICPRTDDHGFMWK